VSRLLFLSHSGIDTEAATALKGRLLAAPAAREHGLSVWFDKDDLRAGEPWQSQLEEAIGKSQAFAVYVGSKGVVNWVEAEVRLALNRAITEPDYRFVPILASAAPAPEALPGFARQFQGVFDVEARPDQFEHLMQAVLGGDQAGQLQLETEPFFGLRAIDESRSHLFFGRERETEALVGLVHRTPLVLVTGDSGSGKSSLVRAGLVPRFRGGTLALLDGTRPEDNIWHVVTTRPRRQPFPQLGDAVDDAAKRIGLPLADRGTLADWAASGEIDKVRRGLRCDMPPERVQVLLVVDQFEELLTITPADLRAPFIDLLLDLADPADGRHKVVLTMRHDYANLCNAYERLKERLDADDRRARFLLGRMSDDGLRRIVTEPLRLAAVEAADREALASEVLRDVGERPGDLALVQMALTETWRARDQHGGDLLRAYADVGRVEGALAKAAERVRAEVLDAGQRDLLDSILLRLVRLGDTGGATRRVAGRSEFDDARWALIQKLASEDGKRLVLLSGDIESPTVEIAHEALVTAWPYFQNLLQDTAADKRVLDMLIHRAQAWATQNDQRERDKRLTTGAELELFAALGDRRAAWFAPRERDHLQASRLAALRRQGIARLAVAALALLTVVAGIASGVAWWLKGEADEGRLEAERQTAVAQKQTRIAEEQADLAKARQLVAQSELSRPNVGKSEESLLLALESLRLSETSEAAAAARKTLAVLAQGKLVSTHDGAVQAIAFSADGRYLATGGSDGRASVWNIESGEEELRVEHEQAITDLSLHPQGLFLATAGRDGKAILWDVSSRQEIYRHETGTIEIEYSTLRDPKMRRRQEQAEVTAVVFSHTGDHLAIAGADGVLKVIDVRSQRPLFSEELGGSVRQVRFSPDGGLVAALRGKEIVLWNLTDGERYGAIPEDSAENLQFDPTGGYIATADSDDRIGLWDVGSQKLVAEFRHDERASQVQFAPEGDVLWSSGADGTIRQWHIETRREGHRIHAGGSVRLLAISSDGDYIASADFGTVARLWKTADGSEVVRFPHGGQISTIAFAPDDEHLAVGSVDGVARLWDLRGGSPAAELEHSDKVKGFAFSDDGASIVTFGASSRDKAKVWLLPEGRWRGTYEFDRIGNAAALAPDGRHLIQTTADRVILTDLSGEVAVIEVALEGVDISERGYSIGAVAISGNGRWIIKEINDVHRLWRIGDGRVELRETFPSSVRSVAFTPDDAHLVTIAATDDAGTELLEVHDLETDQRVASWLSDQPVQFFAISPDNRLLAVPEAIFSRGWNLWKGRTTFRLASNTISIVELTTGEPKTHVTIPNVAAPNRVIMIAFSPDGQYLAAGLADGTTSIVRVEDSEEMARLSHEASLVQIGFSPNQDYLVTGGEDGFLRFWHWRTTDLETAACARITRNFTYHEWTASFGREPYRLTCENLPPHPSLLEEARLLAERSEVEEARVLLARALQLGATIDASPDDWVNQAAAVGLLEDGVSLAKAGRIEPALAAFDEARGLNPEIEISYEAWNAVCWQGALSQIAGKVIEACDRAVEAAPEHGGVHDSRGVVRAQLGDYEGAIADFQVYSAWAPNNARPEEDIAKRRQWIQKLEQGVNPFDSDTLKSLK
jgi:WD40 repeat protein